MRTTLTLDDDVAVKLERLARRRHQPLKAVVNEALRAGLRSLERPKEINKFRTEGFDLGASRIGGLDNIEEVLSRAEGENHR